MQALSALNITTPIGVATAAAVQIPVRPQHIKQSRDHCPLFSFLPRITLSKLFWRPRSLITTSGQHLQLLKLPNVSSGICPSVQYSLRLARTRSPLSVQNCVPPTECFAPHCPSIVRIASSVEDSVIVQVRCQVEIRQHWLALRVNPAYTRKAIRHDVPTKTTAGQQSFHKGQIFRILGLMSLFVCPRTASPMASIEAHAPQYISILLMQTAWGKADPEVMKSPDLS